MIWERSTYTASDEEDRMSFTLSLELSPKHPRGQETGSVEQGGDVGTPVCVSGELMTGGCADSAGWGVLPRDRRRRAGAGGDFRKGWLLQEVLVPANKEARVPLAPSTQTYAACSQASSQNSWVQNVIWVWISHLWPSHESVRAEAVHSGRAWVGEMEGTHRWCLRRMKGWDRTRAQAGSTGQCRTYAVVLLIFHILKVINFSSRETANQQTKQ